MNLHDDMLRNFTYAHLPPFLQAASKPFCDLANDMAQRFQHNSETPYCLRKLLEAKDCFVRAAIEQKLAVDRLEASMGKKEK